MSKRLHCSSVNSSGLFFFFSRKRKEKRKKQLMLCSFIYWPVHYILSWFWKHTVFAGASQWFLPSPAELELCSVLSGGKLLRGKGRKGRWLNHLVMQVSDSVCNPHPLERKKKILSCKQVTTETYSIPNPPGSHTGKQILMTFDCTDIWNVRRGGRFNSRKITRSLESPHIEGSG